MKIMVTQPGRQLCAFIIVFRNIYIYFFPGGSVGKESAYNAETWALHPWFGKITWRRAWQPTPVVLPGESPWTEEPVEL